MGYQESYFTAIKHVNRDTYTSDNARFDEFVETIRRNGIESYQAMGCVPVEIIVISKNTRDYCGRRWLTGTKFVYFCGERFPQQYGNGYTGNALLVPKCTNCNHFRGKKCADGGEGAPWSCKNPECEHMYNHGQAVIFTEDRPARSIWKDAGGKVTAIHELFWPEENK